MFAWLSENWLTIVAGSAVLLIVACAVAVMIKDQKKSKASGGCGGCCGDCSMCGGCGCSSKKTIN